MTPNNLFGAAPELFGPFYVAALLSAYLVAAVMGYRRGWPPASWLLVLAAAGLGGIVGTRVLPVALEAFRALVDGGVAPEATTKRIPGAIAGALIGAEVARRVLGIRQSILEPLAYSGMVALLVVRVGCLVAGCCFGTPTDSILGATYASGSFAHGFHIAEGIVASGAAAPHPVHPIPLYDIVFALGMLALLPRLSKRLRIGGNLCWLTVGAYSVHRFAQDFVRAREVEVFAGLTQIQLAMAAAAILTLGWVALSERRARQRPAPSAQPLAEAPTARLVGLLAAIVAARVALDGWLTAPEAVSLFVRLLPAAAAVAVVLWRSAAAPQARWAATAMAAGLPLMMGFQVFSPQADSTGGERQFTLLAVEAHGGYGRYEEFDICDTDLYEYQTVGGAVAHVAVDLDSEMTRELGLRVYQSTQELAEAPSNPDADVTGDLVVAVHPYVQLEARYAGVHGGLQLGRLAILDGDAFERTDENGEPEFGGVRVAPSFGFRLGPREVHLQGGFLDGPHFGAPAPAIHLGLGTGRLTAAGQEVRVQAGVSGSGYYASGTFALDQFLLEPMIAYAPYSRGDLVHVGARVRYSIPTE